MRRSASVRLPAGALCVALPAAAALILLLMGRPPICRCDRVELWHPVLDAGNSQMLLDWYSPSHVIHGFLFYLASWLIARRRPLPLRLAGALAIECLWEVIENSPYVIGRYRAATMALGYTGDSVINSLSDIGCMAAGFWIAGRLPWRWTLALAALFELVTLWTIRDGLALNVLMLLHPIAAIRAWQAG